MTRLLFLWVGIGLVGLTVVSAAHADRATALDYYRDGMAHYRAGSFMSALRLFEQAYEQDPAPMLKFNMGQAHWKLGNREEAIAAYRAYLSERPDAENRADVEARIHALEADPAFDAEAGGQAQQVQQQEGYEAHEAPAKAQPSVDPDPHGARAESPNVLQPLSSPRGAPSERGTSVMRTAAYLTGGLSLASLATGLVFATLTQNKEDDVASASRFDARAYNAGERYEKLQLGFLAAGTLLAVTAGVLFVLDITSEREDVAVSPLFDSRTAGLVATGTF